ncbi:MAG: hypothetical protein U0228_34300 [Myxococcaceae bacterium]
MSADERELRATLEDTQARLKEAEKRVHQLVHDLTLSQQREGELKAEAEGLKSKLASLSGREPQEMAVLAEQLQVRLAEVERTLAAVNQASPRLPSVGGVCPRCGSRDFAQRATLRGPNNYEILLGVDRDPNAAFFRDAATSRVYAACCAQCGLVEFGAEYPGALLAAWERAKSS